MGVSRDEVLRVAALARLELEDAEVDALTRDLADILSHVADLRTSKIEQGTSNIELPAAGSVPQGGDASEGDALSGGMDRIAPDFRDGFFRVPRLGSHEDSDAGEPTQTHTNRERP